MAEYSLQEVFKISGVPTITFIEPQEYARLIANLGTPGRSLVVEGPSGIGKTSAIENALKTLEIAENVTKLSARRDADIEYIENLPSLGEVGTVIIDDFHKLTNKTKAALADYMKVLADSENEKVKIIVLGINKAGENLISFASDLVNRIDVIPLEINPDSKVYELIERGEQALQVSINVKDEIVEASQGSFYLAQMLCNEICMSEGVAKTCEVPVKTQTSFELIKATVWERLSMRFFERCKRFCRGPRQRIEGRAPYLHILNWLATCNDWVLRLDEAIRAHPDIRGSANQVVQKGYLEDWINTNPEIREVLHFDPASHILGVEDPQFLFFIRNISWKKFADDLGYIAVEFESKYDFALSFAGNDRAIAAAIAEKLSEHEVEVFYDRNERHRMLAKDIEQYLLPIYQSEAKYIVVVLGPDYPERYWARMESEAFKKRIPEGEVIPIWFTDSPPGVFDSAGKIAGLFFNREDNFEKQIESIVDILIQKLIEDRNAVRSG